MLAMRLHAAGTKLRSDDVPVPVPGAGEVLVRVAACAVCRTDLHVVDGELTGPKLPLVPGHEIVGRITARGSGATRFAIGDRVGIPWLGWACGECEYCRSGRENLCPRARFTGYQIDGGYAEFAVADECYCFAIPPDYSDAEAAPLLCAGLIGYRTLRMAGDARRLGLYGFGAAAHIIAQVARWQGRAVYSFTRPGDTAAQEFARGITGGWAGGSDEAPPEPLDAALIFAPLGALVPAALRAVAPGGTVVCGGIHMSDIPAFPYALLWQERTLRSVANLTRRDAEEFLALAPRVPVRWRRGPIRWRRRMWRWTICGPAGCPARRCCCRRLDLPQCGPGDAMGSCPADGRAEDDPASPHDGNRPQPGADHAAAERERAAGGAADARAPRGCDPGDG